MPITLSSFLERTESISPSSAGVSVHTGKAVATYVVGSPEAPVSAQDLQDAIAVLIGDTEIAPGNGALNRTLPVAHPTFPYWTVTNVANIRGLGEFTLTDADASLGVTPLPQFALYDQYDYVVEYGPRPYAILPDSAVTVTTGTWTDPSGATQPYRYANEWIRFTDLDSQAVNNNITAQQGQMTFSTQSGGEPNNFVYAGMPRLYLPDQIIKLRWFQVPYRYITSANSYIVKYQGQINQLAWNGYNPGTLLYLTYNQVRYTPPVPELSMWYPGVFSTDKLCDVEFTFLYTSRTGTDLPNSVSNANWIVGGHNLQPWLQTRQYYYATSKDTGVPTWLSFPLQLLFTDPDAT